MECAMLGVMDLGVLDGMRCAMLGAIPEMWGVTPGTHETPATRAVRGGGRGRGRVGIGGTTRDEKTEEEMLTGDTETAMGTAGVQKNLQI
jgi:hypothetical protein